MPNSVRIVTILALGTVLSLGASGLAEAQCQSTTSFTFEGPGADVTAALSRALGKSVSFVPEDESFSSSTVVFKEFPLAGVLDALAKVGRVEVDGEPHLRVERSPEQALEEFLRATATLEIDDLDGEQLSGLLSRKTGASVSFRPFSDESISLEVSQVTGRQLLELLAARGRLEIDGEVWPLRR